MDVIEITWRAYLRKAIWLMQFYILVCLVTATTANAAQEVTEPLVAVYDTSQASLAEILEGDNGEAYLLYYLPEKGVEYPALVVRLTKEDGARQSIAEVFDAPPGEPSVPVEIIEGYPTLPENLIPTITITALGGWWRHEGIVNYNLDIRVYGSIMTMWASSGDTGWVKFLHYGEPNAQIIVRDNDEDGLPDWDWRTMLPEFPNRGDYRTTYAERKCDTPLRVEGELLPMWPFVAGNSEYGYEQASGIFRPPIVVDWDASRVRVFSEIVTLRNQNCSYGMHSIVRVLPKQLNSPNFEIPFAFYDLSLNGNGFPNLILRTGRNILNTETTGLASEQVEVIRYSWSNEDISDGSMDYKVELFGFHPYNFVTAIADGQALIDAPPYELFPGWVIEKEWPVATFIDAEDINYLTSEGIYEWAPGDLGTDFFRGYVDQGNNQILADIRTGLRGEYRLNTNQYSKLYMSPIDNRLHLKWAETGIWRLDDTQIIRVANLDYDETIDVWSREAMDVLAVEEAGTVPDEDVPVPKNAAAEPVVIESLYALPGHLLHSSSSGLALVATEYERIVFETLPPTDHETWEAHRAQLAPYESQRRDPADLRSWLDAFPGPRSEISGASLDNMRITGNGFRFEMALEQGYRNSGPDLLRVVGLAPGEYLVENDNGVFVVTPLVPPQLTLELRQPNMEGESLPAKVAVGNAGMADAPGLTLVAEAIDNDGATIELLREPVDALGGETAQVLVDIPSTVVGSVLQVRLENAEGQVLAAGGPTPLGEPHPISDEAILSFVKKPVLVTVVGLFSALVALAAVLAASRQRERSAV